MKYGAARGDKGIKFNTESASEEENQRGSHEERGTKALDSPLTMLVKWGLQKTQLKPIPESLKDKNGNFGSCLPQRIKVVRI